MKAGTRRARRRTRDGEDTPRDPRPLAFSKRELQALHDRGLLVGWREQVGLPDLGIESITAKIDTGALTSAISAVDLDPFVRDGKRWIRFTVLGGANFERSPKASKAMVRGKREIRSSHGDSQLRYVIATTLDICGKRIPIEATLANREVMTYPMLIGRTALRMGRFLVHPGRSFLHDLARD